MDDNKTKTVATPLDGAEKTQEDIEEEAQEQEEQPEELMKVAAMTPDEITFEEFLA